MKKTILTIVCMVAALAVTAQTNFREITFDEAIAAAKAEKKLVFIDVMTSWCGPCKMMAREVFPQQSVGDFMNSHFVCIKTDAEKGEGITIKETYGVTAYPTFIIVDTDKKEVAKTVGYKEGGAFVAELERLLNPEATPEKLKARYDGGERTPELMKLYAGLLADEARNDRRNYQEKMDDVVKMVQDYFASLTDAQKLSADNMFVYTVYTKSTEDAAARYLGDNQAKFPAECQSTVKETLEKLYKNEGFMLFGASKTPTKERLSVYKADLQRLGLNKDGYYNNMLRLMEAYEGDADKYMQLCRELYGSFDLSQKANMIYSLENKFKEADEATKKKAARVIREQLPDMETDLLYTAVMSIMGLERQKH